MNIFDDEPERRKATYYTCECIGITLLFWYISGFCVTTVYTFLKYGFSKPVVDYLMSDYWSMFWNPFKAISWHMHWLRRGELPPQYDWRMMGIPVEMWMTNVAALIVLTVGCYLNPHSFANTTLGSARFARDHDIAAMGLIDRGFIMVIGEWKNKLLKMPETLSVLCVAPPGTGKTVAVVVPTILTCNEVSMIVNDVKPELFDITSGYRSKHSYCMRMEWAKSDIPEKGIFYPRWNPLSPDSVPPMGPNRDLYIDRLTNVIIEEPKGNADPHWTKKGRAALAGLLHFIVNKVEAQNWHTIPERWQGKEASIPMLVDWITEATLNAADEIEKIKKTNPMAAMTADPVKNFLMTAVKEARDGGYSQRAIGEMTSLANTPDKERGSIISSMDSGVIVFKNSAVIARTMESDFSFRHFRGYNVELEEAIARGETDLQKYDKKGAWKPLTLYLCVNAEDARALGMITGLLCESLSAWLIAHPPSTSAKKTVVKKTDANGMDYEIPVGPYPSLFVLDEFPQLPKLQALIDGPAVGRGQKVSYLMIGQDLGQIKAKYGQDETETVISTTAAKVVLPLNNEQTAKRFSEMVGQKTLETRSKSRTVGISKDMNPFAFNLQRSYQGQPLIRPEDFMSIEKGKHFVLYQGNKNRPIKCDTPMYFKHKVLKELAYAPRSKEEAEGHKYPPAPFMPAFIHAKRVAEWERQQEQERQKQEAARIAAAEEAARKEALARMNDDDAPLLESKRNELSKNDSSRPALRLPQSLRDRLEQREREQVES